MEDKKEVNIDSFSPQERTFRKKANNYFNNLSKEMRLIIIFSLIAIIMVLFILNTVKLWNIFF